MEHYLKPADMAESLSVSVRTVQRWMEDGRLPFVEVCGIRRVSENAWRAFIQGGGCEQKKFAPARKCHKRDMDLFEPDGRIKRRRSEATR